MCIILYTYLRKKAWLLEKSEIFRLLEILRRRSEIFIEYLYKTHSERVNYQLAVK